MDRVMLAVASGQVSDRVAGPAYCAVIASCLARRDIERARAWTRDLSEWCDSQHGLEPFRGECSVHRANIMRTLGEWEEAEATLADVRTGEKRATVRQDALYAFAEIERLLGRYDSADSSYRQAAALGREVQPGLGYLRRDQGHLAAARSGIARALAASPLPAERADLLVAQTEFAIAAGDLAAAQDAASGVRALADLLGDEEAAQLEFDAARTVFAGLGAVGDLDRLERLAGEHGRPVAAAGLTGREIEVLRLVAQGNSNRQVAGVLFLSERTVARHVANILGKLALPNRAAATAYAFEHGLIQAA